MNSQSTWLPINLTTGAGDTQHQQLSGETLVKPKIDPGWNPLTRTNYVAPKRLLFWEEPYEFPSGFVLNLVDCQFPFCHRNDLQQYLNASKTGVPARHLSMLWSISRREMPQSKGATHALTRMLYIWRSIRVSEVTKAFLRYASSKSENNLTLTSMALWNCIFPICWIKFFTEENKASFST